MGWYVLETHPQAELAVQDRITVLGPTSFLPRMRRSERAHYLLANRSRPNPFRVIFPRYLFVSLELPDDKPLIGIIKRYPGVTAWLGMNSNREAPLAVRDQDIVRLQELAADLCKESPDLILSNDKPKPLPKDAVVRILWAPLEGKVGKIEFDNGIRADVLLAAAGFASKVSLPRELIQAVA